MKIQRFGCLVHWMVISVFIYNQQEQNLIGLPITDINRRLTISETVNCCFSAAQKQICNSVDKCDPSTFCTMTVV